MTLTVADETQQAAPAADTAPEPTKRPGLNTDTLALAGVFVAMFAFLAAVFAVGLAARAVGEHRALEDAIASGGTPAGSGSALTVSLQEFALNPALVDLPAGADALRIENAGAITHNLSVDGRASAMLEAGQSGELDLTGLAPGTYTMRCDVPGHEAAGMSGTLIVN